MVDYFVRCVGSTTIAKTEEVEELGCVREGVVGQRKADK